MSEEAVSQVFDPFFTSKPDKRHGMGLPLFRQAAEQAGGALEIESAPGKGTVVTARFVLSHPDLQPVGDMEGTIGLLRVFHPDKEIDYRHEVRDGRNT